MATQTTFTERSTRSPLPPNPSALDRALGTVAHWLARHSVDILRISLGLVFLGFGALKFVPDLSPAEGLAVRTLDALTLGIVSGDVALYCTAIAETAIGVTMVTGRFLKTGLVLLAGALVGIMSPLVLFFTDLFPDGPTLEAQYIVKDILLAAAGMVVGAVALGARMVVD